MAILGRLEVDWADLGEAGGAALETKIHTAVTKLSQNSGLRWSGILSLGAGGDTDFRHNLGLTLANLKVYVFAVNNGTTPGDETDDIYTPLLPSSTDFSVTQVDEKTINIVNNLGSAADYAILVFPGQMQVGRADFSADNLELPLARTSGTPPTPPAGSIYLFADDASGELKVIDENGTIIDIGSGGGGGSAGLNFVADSDFEANAVGAVPAATGSFTGTGSATITDTVGEVLVGSKSLKLDAGGADDDVYDHVINSIDSVAPFYVGKPAFVRCLSRALAGYSAGGWAFGIYNVTDATLLSETVREVPLGDFDFDSRVSFVPEASKTYALRFFSQNSESNAIAIDQVVVGTQESVSTANITDWEDASNVPTNLVTNLQNHSQRSRVVGDNISVQAFVEWSGASSDPFVTLNVPSGYTVDESKLPAPSTGRDEILVGHWFYRASATGNSHSGEVTYEPGGQMLLFNAMGASNLFTPSANNPETIAANDILTIKYELPITNSSSNVLAAKRSLQQFAANSDTTDADDTTSFVYGVAGASYPASLTANRSKRVQFQEPVQKSDDIRLLVFENADIKQDAERVHPYIVDGANEYGISWNVVDSSTIDVVFHKDGAAPGVPWGDASLAGYTWVAQVVKAGGLAELSAADGDTAGYSRGNKLQTKFLTADVGADGAISDLTFNNLVIGRMYLISAQLTATHAAADANVILQFSQSGIVMQLQSDEPNASATNPYGQAFFVADQTTLTCSAASVAAGSFVRGNNSNIETFAQLVELGSGSLTSDFS